MKAIPMLLLAAILGASRASAGVDLSWDACAGEVGATGTKTLACSGDGIYQIYVNFQPSVTVTDFIGVEGEIAIQTEDGPLADFWSFEPGGMNQGSFAFTDRWAPAPSCTAASPWGPSIDVPTFAYSRAGNRARLLFTEARSTTVPSLAVGNNFVAFRIDIDESHASNFSGCSDPAALAVIQIDLFSTTQLPVMERESGLRGDCITVNGAGPAVCQATPVANRTWGAVKALYR